MKTRYAIQLTWQSLSVSLCQCLTALLSVTFSPWNVTSTGHLQTVLIVSATCGAWSEKRDFLNANVWMSDVNYETVTLTDVTLMYVCDGNLDCEIANVWMFDVTYEMLMVIDVTVTYAYDANLDCVIETPIFSTPLTLTGNFLTYSTIVHSKHMLITCYTSINTDKELFFMWRIMINEATLKKHFS